jgi:deazaflavin-dependent oxidoreductase (nitroreductase family)
MADWNTDIIEEFRRRGGLVGGPFEGRPILLLRSHGAKTGQERVNPLAYQDLGEGVVAVFASKGGSDTNPDWYHNLLAHPRVQIEIGEETRDVKARVAEGEERARIWTAQKEAFPTFAAYEENTPRVIPVIVLEPADG